MQLIFMINSYNNRLMSLMKSMTKVLSLNNDIFSEVLHCRKDKELRRKRVFVKLSSV